MSAQYDLITGRDAHGHKWVTKLPPGVARKGMYVRLFGGVIILVEQVERCGGTRERICQAMEVMQSVWRER